MNYDELDYQSVTTREAEVSAAFPALMRKVYVWMTFALAITGITAYLVAPGSDVGAHHCRTGHRHRGDGGHQ